MKSPRRHKVEGKLDQIGGRLLEAVGRLTGRSSHKVKGKASRARGAAKKGMAHVKDVHIKRPAH